MVVVVVGVVEVLVVARAALTRGEHLCVCVCVCVCVCARAVCECAH